MSEKEGNGTGWRRLPAASFVPIVGKWEIDDERIEFVKFDDDRFQIGIALSGVRSTSGHFRATVELSETEHGCAHFVLGHDPQSMTGYTVGLGGFDRAFSISEYFFPKGSRMVLGLGAKESLKPHRRYLLEAQLQAQTVVLSVEGTRVLEHTLPHPLVGDQFGLKGYGEGRVAFSDVEARLFRPRAFIVMQFSEPYDSLWVEVIRPIAEKVGFEAYRADDVFHPGVVLQDIVRGIRGSDVVIAEVTPKNPNVFYELGFAHALGKPTILLAEQPTDATASLPFDISGFRCIFYDDAIRGKSKVEAALERHLRNIRDRNETGIVTEE
jgi:hypothetical protein